MLSDTVLCRAGGAGGVYGRGVVLLMPQAASDEWHWVGVGLADT